MHLCWRADIQKPLPIRALTIQDVSFSGLISSLHQQLTSLLSASGGPIRPNKAADELGASDH